MGKDYPLEIEQSFEISESASSWTVRALSALISRLSVNIKLHDDDGRIHQGDIFLFNHFARFETFIPQYLIYQETGAYCRSVAAAEFFADDSVFSKYLLGLGAVPNDYPRLLPFLAAEILRGRRVVVFPEGGMVKDRRVIDRDGEFRVYSRTANERRKHHTGAAVLALTLDAFKAGIREAHCAGESELLERWTERLGLDSVEALIAAADRPTTIIPANITFYPLRVGDNLLQRVGEFFAGGMPKQLAEELVIEGNILLKDTDMDIRLGTPLVPVASWRWPARRALVRLVRRVGSLDALFAEPAGVETLDGRLVLLWLRRKVFPLRDAYMREMYANVTVNLSHLAAQLVMKLIARGETEIDQVAFHRALYLAIKNVQKDPTIKLHRGLEDPRRYAGLLAGECAELERLFAAAARLELVDRDDGHYRFLAKLCEDFDFDEIRIENPVAVAANEVAPVSRATRAVEQAIDRLAAFDARAEALARFDDMRRTYVCDKARVTGPRHAEINAQETATEDGAPYLLLPEGAGGLGIVLVHGFLASPAELRGFGERLAEAGHKVIGVRLNGHGTSPWDLRERTWQDWMEPVREGYRIMAALAERVCLVGFSSGGALSLVLAAEHPERLAGVAAVSAPLKFMNRNLIFVPLVHGANKITKWVPTFEGVMPFRENESEHPHINYRHMAIRGLFELRRMVDEMEKRLPDVVCPVLIVQGDEDPVVDPKSADLIFAKLGTAEKSLRMVPAKRHGILNENTAGAQDLVIDFLAALARQETQRTQATQETAA